MHRMHLSKRKAVACSLQISGSSLRASRPPRDAALSAVIIALRTLDGFCYREIHSELNGLAVGALCLDCLHHQTGLALAVPQLAAGPTGSACPCPSQRADSKLQSLLTDLHFWEARTLQSTRHWCLP